MLSTEERKNRLEELLIRVQRNRVILEKGRSAAAAQGPADGAGVPALAEDSARLPRPAEPTPSPVVAESSAPTDKVEKKPPVSLGSATPAEPEPTVPKSRPVPVPTPTPEAPEVEAVAEESDASKAAVVDEQAKTFVPERTPVSNEVSQELSPDAPTIQPQPEVVKRVFQESPAPQPEKQPETVQVFEGTAAASGEVAVVHGAPEQSWTLDAVLTRAWKLDLTK